MTATTVEWMGVAPHRETPAAAPNADAVFRLALLYRLAVRRALGDEPDGAKLRVLRTPPGRPTPFELACEYDPADPLAVEYADFCRTAAPPTWAAAGMLTPAVGCLLCGPRGGDRPGDLTTARGGATPGRSTPPHGGPDGETQTAPYPRPDGPPAGGGSADGRRTRDR